MAARPTETIKVFLKLMVRSLGSRPVSGESAAKAGCRLLKALANQSTSYFWQIGQSIPD
jgi:hypothetical protein